MTTRLLLMEDWHKVTDPDARKAMASSPNCSVLVVEDDNGDIVGGWVIVHASFVGHCWNTRSRKSKGRAVVIRLLDVIREWAVNTGRVNVIIVGSSRRISRFAKQLGGSELPTMFDVPITRRRRTI